MNFCSRYQNLPEGNIAYDNRIKYRMVEYLGC